MNAPSVDIADMLVAESSLSLAIGDDLFVGKEPTSPDNCVTIIDSYGYPPQLTIAGQGEDYYYPTVDIRVRNKDYRAGMDLIQDIVTVLHGRHGEVWNGTTYTLIKCSSSPAMLGWDDNGKVRFTTNFEIQRR